MAAEQEKPGWSPPRQQEPAPGLESAMQPQPRATEPPYRGSGKLHDKVALVTGATIVNTASVTAYRGSPQLIDYSATKGAIMTFTRSLSLNLAKRQIRVNAVAPGPIWTPLIPSTFPEGKVESFGKDVPMERPGQPEEVAPCYVFLASDDSSYMSGQVLHPNGGEMVGG